MGSLDATQYGDHKEGHGCQERHAFSHVSQPHFCTLSLSSRWERQPGELRLGHFLFSKQTRLWVEVGPTAHQLAALGALFCEVEDRTMSRAPPPPEKIFYMH